jgi:hypothetical protein
MPGTQIGGILGGITKRLKKLGVDEAVIRQAMVDQAKAVAVRLTAANRKRIQELLVEEGDRCLLLRSKRNKVRVVSYEGYKTQQESGSKLSQRHHGHQEPPPAA